MGMYTECLAELVRTLKAAGCEREPFVTRKRMLASSESRISAVLCEEDLVERAGGKKIYAMPEGGTKKRNRKYTRDISWTVVIGDYSQEKAEETFERFLLELPGGIYVDGNYVGIEPTDAQWMGEKDHILFAKVAVQLKVVCHGGLYKDTDMLRLRDIETEIRKGE